MLKKDLAIIPECYTDTCLVEIITSLEGCGHQKGCSMVSKIMQGKFNDQFAVGMIDRDKRRIAYLDEFDTVGSKDSLTLYKHANKPHYIIEISPAVEGFILDSAKELGVTLSNYDLPNTLNELKKITKKIDSKKDPRLRKLFRDLKPASDFKTLSNLLSYLMEERYNCDLLVLRSRLH